MFRREGVELMFGEIKRVAARLRRRLRRLLPRELAARVAAPSSTPSQRLRDLGHIYEADGATWLRTTEFGDDKDRVVHQERRRGRLHRGRPRLLPQQARARLRPQPDHARRRPPRLRRPADGVAAAFGDTPYVNLEVLIGQLVNLVKDGEPMRMSKRAGTVVTMEDLVEAVGVDAARYALVRSSVDSALDVDLDLRREAHQRQPRLLRAVRARPHPLRRPERGGGGRHPRGDGVDAFDPSLLTHPTETALLGTLERVPAHRRAGRRAARAAPRRQVPRAARRRLPPLVRLAAASSRPPARTSRPCTAPAAWSTRRSARC